MTSPPSWHQTWNLAQPRLQAIRDSLPSIARVAPRVLRVNQLDAELLDQELLQILTDPLAKAIGLIQSSYRSRFELELTLLVHLILYKYSVWDLGATYGAKLQNLRYNVPSALISRPLAPSGLPRRTLYAHATTTILIPYLHSRLRVYALSRAWPDAPSSDSRRKAWNFLTRIESWHTAFGLANFTIFLCDGRYRTWADRLLRLRLVSSQSTSTRQVSYEFMNRQMVWHAFTEFLLFLLPLINTRVLRRRISHTVFQAKFITSFAKSALGIQNNTRDVVGEKTTRRGKYWSLSNDQCAICAEDAFLNVIDPHNDIYNTTSTTMGSSSTAAPTDDSPQYPLNTPYMSSCGHHYCYVCLSGRMLRAADDGEHAWECLRCDAMVLSADRVEGRRAGEGDYDLDLNNVSLESDDFLIDDRE